MTKFQHAIAHIFLFLFLPKAFQQRYTERKLKHIQMIDPEIIVDVENVETIYSDLLKYLASQPMKEIVIDKNPFKTDAENLLSDFNKVTQDFIVVNKKVREEHYVLL